MIRLATSLDSPVKVRMFDQGWNEIPVDLRKVRMQMQPPTGRQ